MSVEIINGCSDNSDSKGLFYLSGSQPFKLMELASDSLAGRVAIIELPPLSLREIMKSNYTSPFLPTMEYVQDRNKEAIEEKIRKKSKKMVQKLMKKQRLTL